MLARIVPLLLLVPGLTAQEPSRLEVQVSGLILSNAFYNTENVNNSDVPTFVIQVPASGFPDHAFGAAIRQTQVRITATRAGVAGGNLLGEIETDFFGGQQPSGGGRTHPLLRIRRAFIEMQWPSISLLIGQEAPPISGINPSSFASLGFPGFASAGNLWLWLPQVRITGHLAGGEGLRLALQGAVLAPHDGNAQNEFLTQPDLAERSGRPSVEARVLGEWGENDALGEISVGGHYGWIATDGDSLLDSRAVAISVRAPLTRWLEVRGEVFTGQALAGLGGGGIGQNLSPSGSPVETTGGWAQVVLRPQRIWEVGAGLGIDDPVNGDVDSLTGRQRNRAATIHLLWRPAPLIFAIEYRHLQTTYGAGPLGGNRSASHINLAAGVEF